MTFSVVLLFAATVLVRSYWNLSRVDLGYDHRRLLTFWITPSESRHPVMSIPQLYRRLERELQAIPGVRAVATSFDLPTAGRSFSSSIVREGTTDGPRDGPHAWVQMVSPSYFGTLGLPLLEGRDFGDGDTEAAARVMIVNQAFADRLYPGRSAVGRRALVFEQIHTIIGVVRDARLGMSLWDRPDPEMFLPADQMGQGWRYVLLRAAGDPAAILPAVRATVRGIDPTLPLAELATLEERVDRSMAPQRFRGLLLGALGAFALMLSVIGIYSVVAYAATRRSREIGIRLALGEKSGAVRRRILQGAMLPAVVGTVLGSGGALAAARWLETFVLGVDPRDGATLLLVSGLFLIVTALAAYGPARRASLVDPTTTLKAH